MKASDSSVNWKSLRNIALIAIVLILIVGLLFGLLFAFLCSSLLFSGNSSTKDIDVYVGVDVGYGGENDVRKVAEAVKGYANLIILGSLQLTTDTPALTRVCNYLYSEGFSFIIYVGYTTNPTGFPPRGPAQNFFNETVKQWGDKFLGVYMFDEVGGKQIDYNITQLDKPVPYASSYADATQRFVHILNNALQNYTGPSYYNAPSMRVFTSDYALYWFDYLFGYNVVLGEFAGNHSRQIAVSLCRGAAKAHHMDWGTMITWKYTHPPFLENGFELYNDMVLAYENNAKYLVILNSYFDPNSNNTALTELGILQPEHLQAMKEFWNYAQTNKRPSTSPANTAYVLPADYGFGFRGPNDNIWGLWPADSLAPKIWNDVNYLIELYDKRLDIVYEALSDNLPVRLEYDNLIYWNSSVTAG